MTRRVPREPLNPDTVTTEDIFVRMQDMPSIRELDSDIYNPLGRWKYYLWENYDPSKPEYQVRDFLEKSPTAETQRMRRIVERARRATT